jgi:hypothetical protein
MRRLTGSAVLVAATPGGGAERAIQSTKVAGIGKETTVNLKRLVFGLAAPGVAAGLLLIAQPASAHDDCDYERRYSRRSYYDDYDYNPRYRLRSSYYESRKVVRRYACDDCGDSFGSRYWLNYHHRNSRCD